MKIKTDSKSSFVTFDDFRLTVIRQFNFKFEFNA